MTNKETLEEAAFESSVDYKPFEDNLSPKKYYEYGFIKGAEWQSEKMYNEFIEFGEWIRIKDFQTTSKNNWIGLDMKYYTTEELLEQFKKK